MTEQTKKPSIWLVPHPTYVYAEDVKAQARRAGLRVVDPAFASAAEVADAMPEKDAPKLTIKPEFKPAKAAAKE